MGGLTTGALVVCGRVPRLAIGLELPGTMCDYFCGTRLGISYRQGIRPWGKLFCIALGPFFFDSESLFGGLAEHPEVLVFEVDSVPGLG